MIIRETCIFCHSKLKRTFFERDLENYTGHYAVNYDETTFVKIPYNVSICDTCNTPQTKYLGDLKEIYRINHADSTGKVMQQLHDNVLKIMNQYHSKINGIIEVGGARGILADKVINCLPVPYTIIDPAYFGSHDNRLVIKDLYENVDDTSIKANTIIMSHVFEHFYDPLIILNKITANHNIKYLFLVFPNLEAYIQNGILHVLNIEHTFYVDNAFLERLFAQHGFVIRNKTFYDNHSVIFCFERTHDIVHGLGRNEHDIALFFNKVERSVASFNHLIDSNPTKNLYLFPASIHAIFLTIMGLKYQHLTAMLDNSPLKIGKKMYGINVPIHAFNSVFNDKNALVLLNGGVFNQEVVQSLQQNNINYVCN